MRFNSIESAPVKPYTCETRLISFSFKLNYCLFAYFDLTRYQKQEVLNCISFSGTVALTTFLLLGGFAFVRLIVGMSAELLLQFGCATS